jgi:hypothetical protein
MEKTGEKGQDMETRVKEEAERGNRTECSGTSHGKRET